MKLKKYKTQLSTDNKSIAKIVMPRGFKLVVDTAEQSPLFLDGQHKMDDKLRYRRPEYKRIPIVVKPISKHKKDGWEGDYSIDGMEHMFGIERKENDLYQYIGIENKDKKTEKKLRRLSEMEFGALVVQKSYDALREPQLYTNLTHNHLDSFLKRAEVKYGIHVFCHPNRRMCELKILQWATYYYRLKAEQRRVK